MSEKIKYQAIWGKLYILLGVLFGALFIIGGVILNDPTVYLNTIASFIIIYIGISMIKKPYALYNTNEIKVYNFLGTVRHHYKFESKEEVTLKSRRFYMNENNLRINPWMIDKQDWVRMENFFDAEGPFMNELQD